MNDPKRLLDEGATDAERELLRSWQSEAPSPGARRALLGAALGAGIGTASSAAAGASAPKVTATVGAWALGKWIVIGAFSGLATITTVNVVLPPAAQTEPRAVEQIASPSKVKATVSGDSVKPSAVDEPKPTENESPSNTPVAAGGGGNTAKNTVVSVATPRAEDDAPEPEPSSAGEVRARSTLTDETDRMTAVRQMMQSGQASAALAAIDAYQKLYPTGAFTNEATMLRITAEVTLGRRAEALKTARPFCAAPANAIYVARIRAMLPELDNE